MKLLAYQLNAAFCSLLFLLLAIEARGTFLGGFGLIGFVFTALLEILYMYMFVRHFHNI